MSETKRPPKDREGKEEDIGQVDAQRVNQNEQETGRNQQGTPLVPDGKRPDSRP